MNCKRNYKNLKKKIMNFKERKITLRKNVKDIKDN